MSDEAVCRTAPATPGLLKTQTFPSRPGHQANIYTLKTTCLGSCTICWNLVGLEEGEGIIFLLKDLLSLVYFRILETNQLLGNELNGHWMTTILPEEPKNINNFSLGPLPLSLVYFRILTLALREALTLWSPLSVSDSWVTEVLGETLWQYT